MNNGKVLFLRHKNILYNNIIMWYSVVLIVFYKMVHRRLLRCRRRHRRCPCRCRNVSFAGRRLLVEPADQWPVWLGVARAESIGTLGARCRPSLRQFRDSNVSPPHSTRLRFEYIKTTTAKGSQNARSTFVAAVSGYLMVYLQ